jgi:hypothetical protein
MPVPLSPPVAAEIVARNVAPLAGVLFFHWDAGNVLLLYFLDTMLAVGVIIAGLVSTLVPVAAGWAGRIRGEAGGAATALFTAAFFAVPMGVPLVFVLGPIGFDWRAALADDALRGGAAMQCVAACWSYWALRQALRTAGPDALRLKRRFALVFLRWLAVLMAIYSGIALVAGPLVVVAVYVGASIWSEVAPDRFLRAMPGGAEDADPDPDAPPAAPSSAVTPAEIDRARARHDRRRR